MLPKAEKQNLQDGLQLISHIILLTDTKPGSYASTASIYYQLRATAEFVGKQTNTHATLQENKKIAVNSYESTVACVPAACKAVWA